MKIAVLGWGSLIWNTRELSVEGDRWYEDGPSLPLEFKRVSRDGRLTLVICPKYSEIASLYAISSFDNLDQALSNLMLREGTTKQHIGFYNVQNGEQQIKRDNNSILPRLTTWLKEKGLDAVIWTDLPPNFKERTQLDFTIENVRTHLKKLNTESFKLVKQYVVNAPAQIQTKHRAEIQAVLDQLSGEFTSD